MKLIRMGIYDPEEAYVTRLAAFLERKGEGRYKILAFTSREKLMDYIEHKPVDVLLGTSCELLLRAKQKKEQMALLWLKESNTDPSGRWNGITDTVSVSRYAGAHQIYRVVQEIVFKIEQAEVTQSPVMAIYSPVGRCGKTTLALQFIKNQEYGSFLYVGMEDYASLTESDCSDVCKESSGDEFLYYLKERKEERLWEVITRQDGVIPSAFSPFDRKQMTEEDWKWMMEQLHHQKQYAGTVCDVGTGILVRLEWLRYFDYIVDLNSTNGTFVNGEAIISGEEILLEEGDLVGFACCEFYVVRKV